MNSSAGIATENNVSVGDCRLNGGDAKNNE
jgi:hypothetical protein